MSGRPYARNPRAPYAGPTDLQAVLPHHFRVQAPRPPTRAMQLAIRRAIRRRCMEKNWKKMIAMRHRRLAAEEAAEEAATNPPPAAEERPQSPPADQNDSKSGEVATEDAKQPAATMERSVDAKAQQDGTAVSPKQQLEELQQRLQALTDQKHAKFQLLKEILVQEARSKISGGSSTSAASTTPTATTKISSAGASKKRRVEFKSSVVSPPKPAPMASSDQNPATLLSPPPAAVMAQSPEPDNSNSMPGTPGSRPPTTL